jgi:bifunctional oligoribonuclease and PAP phosphatase NrnA
MRFKRIPRNDMFRFFSTIDPSTHILLCTHENPDIDGVSSLGVLFHWLTAKGFSVQSIIQPPIPGTQYLHGVATASTDPSLLQLQKPPMVVSLDCATSERIWPQSILSAATMRVNIDHHIDNPLFGDQNYVDPTLSSTAELLYTEVRKVESDLPLEILENCYAGILFDTGGFRYSNTTDRTFQHAKEMVQLGVHPARMAQNVFQSYSSQTFQALQCALQNCAYEKQTPSYVFAHVSHDRIQEHQLASYDFEGVVDILRLHQNTDIVVLVRELGPNQWRGSIRSVEHYSILGIAHSFLGGGHHNAAGFSFHGTLQELQKRILTQISSLSLSN